MDGSRLPCFALFGWYVAIVQTVCNAGQGLT